MLSTYCQECGSKNEYLSQRPKFCGNCGAPLSSEAKNTVIKRKKIPPKKSEAASAPEEDEEGTDVYEVPDISNFEYEVEYSPASTTLGSILPQPPSQPKKKRGRPRKNTQGNGTKKKN